MIFSFKKTIFALFLAFVFGPFFNNTPTGTFEQEWQFSVDTNEWANLTTLDVWEVTGYTFAKVDGSTTPSGGFTENWTYVPATNQWSESSANWENSDTGIWDEHTSSTSWHYFSPTSNQPRGTWRQDGTGVVWYYNDTNQIWNETGTSNTKFFPPFLPFQAIVQHQEILSAYDYLSTREIPLGTTNIHWTDSYEDLICDYTTGAWTWTAPSYEPTGNITAEWKDNVAFSGPGGGTFSEKWTLAESSTASQGRSYTNASATVSSGEVIHYNAASNSWRYSGGGYNHGWIFNPTTNEWSNFATNARYEYDTRDRAWVQVDKGIPVMVWQSKYDATNGWIWHDTINNVQWTHYSGVWKNMSTNATYTTSGNKLQDNLLATWSYTPAAWTKDGVGTTAALFPLLPPNPAGQIGRIQQQGYILAQTHLTTGSSYKTSADSQTASLTSVLGLRGTNRTTAATPLVTPAQTLATQIDAWHTTYQQLLNPFRSSTHVFIPTTSDGTFATWNPVGWRLPAAGKGIVQFQAKGSSKLSIGLSTNPTTNGTAEYTITSQATNTTSTISDSGGTVTTLSTTTFLPTDSTFHDYWISYNNGVVTFGTGSLAHNNTIWSADLTSDSLTLANSGNLLTIRYISFAKPSGTSWEFRNIRTLPYETARAYADATNVYQRATDEVLIGGWQDDIDSEKPSLVVVASNITTTDRASALQNIATALATPLSELNIVKTATDDNGYGTTNALESALSQSAFDDVYTEVNYASIIATNYQTAATNMTVVSTAITALFNALSPTLASNDFITTLNTTKTTITNTLNTIEANLIDLKNKATTLQGMPGNSTLSTLVTMLTEELAFIQAQKASLTVYEKFMYFKYYETVVTQSPNATGAQTDAMYSALDDYNTASDALIASFATTLAAGNSNLYAIITALVGLSTKKTTDQVRSEVVTHFSTNAELHIFPGVGHPYTNTATGVDVIATGKAAIEKTLTQAILTGSTWNKGARVNLFNNANAFNINTGSAPLKITTSSSQLLYNLLKNPTYSLMGTWQYTDTANDHTWYFTPSNNELVNTTTGDLWTYASTSARTWISPTGETWKYDEKAKTWTQKV